MVINLTPTLTEKVLSTLSLKERLALRMLSKNNATLVDEYHQMLCLFYADDIAQKIANSLFNNYIHDYLKKNTLSVAALLVSLQHMIVVLNDNLPLLMAIENHAKKDWAMLFCAEAGDYPHLMQGFYDIGGNVNAVNFSHSSVLMLAIKHSHIQTAEQLLDWGASVNIKSLSGYTALHYASAIGNTALLSRLLSQKIKLNARTREGETPLWIALYHHHTDAAALLASHKGCQWEVTANGMSIEQMLTTQYRTLDALRGSKPFTFLLQLI